MPLEEIGMPTIRCKVHSKAILYLRILIQRISPSHKYLKVFKIYRYINTQTHAHTHTIIILPEVKSSCVIIIWNTWRNRTVQHKIYSSFFSKVLLFEFLINRHTEILTHVCVWYYRFVNLNQHSIHFVKGKIFIKSIKPVSISFCLLSIYLPNS